MKLIQLNIRSLNTSTNMMDMLVARRNPDILLLQEVWQPKNQALIKGFQPPIMKLRHNSRGGGVAIYTKKAGKQIYLPKYEVNDLEAVWAEVMIGNKRTVVGSVYIPPGKINEMRIFKRVLNKVCLENNNVIIGMDANARNSLWDDNSVARSGSESKAMGDELLEAIIENKLESLNNGEPTHHSEARSSAIDVTIAKGITKDIQVTWQVLKDPVRSDHSHIQIQVGGNESMGVLEIKDWNKMDW